IVQLVNRYALAYPNISFRLVNDHKLQFVSPGNNSVIDILANIYTKDVARQMIAFSGKNRDYEISGYTSNPILNRSSSNYVHLFVNQRQIIDTKIINVIRECYEQLIPKNRYPIAVLYINCDPSIIDVNIHPRKQEIKFSEYQKLLDLIRATLEPKLKHTPIFQTPEKEVVDQLKMTFSEEEKSYSAHSQTEETPVQKHQTTSYQTFEKTEKRIPDMEYIGQFYGTYLIFQNEEGLYLLDQHAAAERIRYERYLANMAKRHPESQKLVVPMILTLSKDLLLEISDRLNELAEYGLVTDIEGNSLCISQIPAWFYPGYELIYAEEMVMTLANETSLAKKQVIDDLAKLLACKHSLKANHYVTKEEANHLLEDLRKCEKPYTCPHGRPIIVNFSLATIERWFNRVI
nr:hypothetical protein [Bacillota bacterium]